MNFIFYFTVLFHVPYCCMNVPYNVLYVVLLFWLRTPT